MQIISKEAKSELIKQSLPESQEKPVPALLDPPVRPLRIPPRPRTQRQQNEKNTRKKLVINIKRKRVNNKKKRGYRRRKKQKYKAKPLILSLPSRGIIAPKPKGLLDYKNLPLLRQYLTAQGKIRSRKKTCLTSKEQRQVANTIKTARAVAFLPFIRR